MKYFGVQVLMKIRLGKNEHSTYYTLYATHGGVGRGGKANNLERLKNIVLCDIYCITHGQMSFPFLLIPDQ